MTLPNAADIVLVIVLTVLVVAVYRARHPSRSNYCNAPIAYDDTLAARKFCSKCGRRI